MARYLYPQQCGKSEGLAWKDWVARRLGTQVGAVLSVAHRPTDGNHRQIHYSPNPPTTPSTVVLVWRPIL